MDFLHQESTLLPVDDKNHPGPDREDLKEITMNVERILRGVAGFFILLSLALSQLHSPYWLIFTAFVGVNLFQSFFTNWCLLMTILRKAGVPDGTASSATSNNESRA
jgi:hypothetical protein